MAAQRRRQVEGILGGEWAAGEEGAAYQFDEILEGGRPRGGEVGWGRVGGLGSCLGLVFRS